MEEITFTPDNLIENIGKLGPWSCWHLLEIAAEHYYPHIKEIDDVLDRINAVAGVIDKMGFTTASEVVIKYHKEIGYKESSMSPEVVNQY